MSEDQLIIEHYKILLTSAGIILTLGTLIFGIIRYNKEKKRLFQKSFYETQLEIYMKVANHVSNIYINKRDTEEFIEHYNEFRKYFYGQMCLIEDKSVEKRMIQYSTVLEWYNKSIPESEQEGVLKDMLQRFTIILSHTFRNSTLSTWNISSKFLEEFNDATNSPELDDKLILICDKLIRSNTLTWKSYIEETDLMN